MKGEVAIVSGGAQGIGLATVQLLARQGYRVLVLDRNADVDARAAALRVEGLDVTGLSIDITDRAQINAALEREARIHVVICAAGVIIPKPIEEQTDSDFRRTFDVNVHGMFALAQEALSKMRSGGRMVMVASRGVLGDRNNVAYISSKGAVVAMVRAMAFELRDRLINVNAVAPGFTDTPMIRVFGEAGVAAASSREARGRPARPDEIAPAIAFLASPEAALITGQTLFVDGGKSLGGLAGAV